MFMNDKILSELTKRFQEKFPDRKEVFLSSAPGRVNLIGEHTDYNNGYVMPLAIERRVYIAFSPNQSDHVNLFSINYGEHDFFTLQVIPRSEKHWANYLRGIFKLLKDYGCVLSGMDALIYGDIPIGAGLSSSAAIETATIMAADHINETGISTIEQIKLAQRCENEFVGVNCGIMDQFISRMGMENYALMLDCKDLSCKHIAVNPNVVIIVSDTGIKRNLNEVRYNLRREECEKACRLLEIGSLRDLTIEEFLDKKSQALPEHIKRRTKHVLKENQRVIETAIALNENNLMRAGKLMFASHLSLKEDFEVSCPELDTMVEIAKSIKGVYGCRMTGAGFGGCTVSLVEKNSGENFINTMKILYKKKTGLTPEIFATQPSKGACVQRL